MRPDARVDLGVIQVHKNVIADICTAAIAEVEGVTIARNDAWEGLLGSFGVKKNSGVDVIVDTASRISVVVNVVVRYGLNLSETSLRVQDAVLTAVEKMADIHLKDVDVNIQGIERG